MADEKTILHPRNKHRSNYDFVALTKSLPALKPYVAINKYGNESIDFSDPAAVKALNKALLSHFYNIANWDIPEGYLCPPIPGRADYVHYLADLLEEEEPLLKGKNIKVLDIGIGANCVYPIIGHQEYGWTFVGTDIDPIAVKAAKAIVAANPDLSSNVEVRHQPNKNQIFQGIIKPGDSFTISMCNPPFHSSAEEANAGSKRKLQNLGKHKGKETTLNFGGQAAELWTEGGEITFIRKMIDESKAVASQCKWFSSLVSKSANLPFIYSALDREGVTYYNTIDMAQGQKISRFVVWTFS
ncbi:MAG: 23S rRNA (adenine(1618)-N(6))-methyltransferase RlmF [Pedobacter sp.]|nr:MAG: 23S rRNA (adenine(1618)-N(6))-methyltransferase RlmF [Pedobacter sp.]